MNNILSHLTSVHTHTPYNFKIPFNIIILSKTGVSLVPSLCTLQHKFVCTSFISKINFCKIYCMYSYVGQMYMLRSFITSTFTTTGRSSGEERTDQMYITHSKYEMCVYSCSQKTPMEETSRSDGAETAYTMGIEDRIPSRQYCFG